MVDQVVTIQSNTVVVTGGTDTITVETDFGAQGIRGGLIHYGPGNPSTLSISEFPKTPQNLDWYINIKTNDPEYLYIYQYTAKPEGNSWDRVFKIIPNSYSTNIETEFSGEAEANTVYIPIAETGIVLLDGIDLTDITVNAHVEVANSLPTATSFIIGPPSVYQGSLALPISIVAAELNPLDGSWSALSGIKTVHVTLNVI
jgi:hypothetical protein